jgi:ABC-type transport system involved in cytochrome bd biosynthesis fused ATPase/permease subunit
LSINKKTHVRGAERRRKRIITPIIYFFAETIFVWLVLALIQINFNMLIWSFWAIAIFIIAVIYSIIKTVNVYQRQKGYLEVDEEKV